MLLRLAFTAFLFATAGALAATKPPGKEVSPGVREIELPDGGLYRGSVKGGAFDGRGELVGPDFRYEGGFRDGLKQGHGVLEWKNGDRYEGLFADDHPEGWGEFRFASGDRYEGEVH